jgi:hypothetical protein
VDCCRQLVLFPAWGFPVAVVQSVIFLHEATTKLLTAYPSRRLVRPPLPNHVLHGALAFGVGLQILVVVVPAMRTTLEVQALSWAAVGALTAAVVVVTAVLVELAAVAARHGAANMSPAK